MVSATDTDVYRSDVQAKGQQLSVAEREKLLERYLPTPVEQSPARDTAQKRNGTKTTRKTRRTPVRSFLKSQLHILLYYLIHLVFGVYLRLRQIYHATIDRVLAILYYHHRTPELIRKDVKNLDRLPEHLSVIVTFRGEEDGGLEALMDEVAELCAWCASAGIPLLSVYEKSGILKSYIPSLHALTTQKLSSYFGPPPATPHLRVSAPNHPSHSPFTPLTNPSSPPSHATNGTSTGTTNGHRTSSPLEPDQYIRPPAVSLLLLSSTDGRDTLVDLTRTLTEMSRAHKLRPADITSELINTEICATTALPTTHHLRPSGLDDTAPSSIDSGEPDLLIIFGPTVRLEGYPPWQVRLTEIFCVGDSGGDITGRVGARVEYQAFLRGLWRFARADMKFGR